MRSLWELVEPPARILGHRAIAERRAGTVRLLPLLDETSGLSQQSERAVIDPTRPIASGTVERRDDIVDRSLTGAVGGDKVIAQPEHGPAVAVWAEALVARPNSVTAGGVDPRHDCDHAIDRRPRELHVDTDEPEHRRATRRVIGTHPPNEVQHFVSVPGPEVHATDQRGWIAFAGAHVPIDVECFRETRLDGEDREPHALDEKFERAMLHAEEFTCAVAALAKPDEPRIAD